MSIGLVIAIAGCDRDVPPQGASSAETTSTVATSSTVSGSIAATGSLSPDSLRDDLVEHGLRVPSGPREVVIAELGRPDSVQSHAVPNGHNPAITDSVAYLFYPGLRLDYLVATGDHREFLEIADVSDNRYVKYRAVGIGANAAAIASALGEPWQRADDAYSYVCGSCIGADHPVIFYLNGGRVVRVEYQFYVD